jgi:hypothetical protein
MGGTLPRLLAFLSNDTGDLTALQKMLNHTNEVVEDDYADVKTLADNVTKIRQNLDSTMMQYRQDLEPACKDFASLRTAMFDGAPGKMADTEVCLAAQGKAKVMLDLDYRVSGCDEACGTKPKDWSTWARSDRSMYCDHGPCHGTLRCMQQIEAITAGTVMRTADEDALRTCNTQAFDLLVAPPMQMQQVKSQTIEDQSMCHKGPAADDAGHAGNAGAVHQSSMPANIDLLLLQAVANLVAKHQVDGGKDNTPSDNLSENGTAESPESPSKSAAVQRSQQRRKHGSETGSAFLSTGEVFLSANSTSALIRQ